ncbi:MAG: peptidoglycan editing factor PgeF [Lachnospiraceae bacterium]|nr:peptidoglycan editing factor PgeF [Lachnospiraceae bacterium]
MKLNYKNQEKTIRKVQTMPPYLVYPLLEETGFVRHGFSTKLGGVSVGCYASLNLSFTRGDETKHVQENLSRFGKAIGVKPKDMVFSAQTHTNHVLTVTESDRGNGVTQPLPYADVDGFVTNIPGLCLVTFYADCVPLFFVDPVAKAIGLSHSGWRGTVAKIAEKTVEQMKKEYGSNPADILTAIGPSICRDCYEVSEEVIGAFRQNFAYSHGADLYEQKENGKYQLDLWAANRMILLESGILPKHIAMTNVCTHCNSDVFYSHRRTGERRGNLAAFLAIK